MKIEEVLEFVVPITIVIMFIFSMVLYYSYGIIY